MEWVVPVDIPFEPDLRFASHDDETAFRFMVGQIQGAKIEIFSNEHPPPHFRVKKAEIVCSFDIDTCVPLPDQKIDRRIYRAVLKWHEENKDLLIKTWNERRPTNCPVGKIDSLRGRERRRHN
jgi:hypothetical protein